MAQKLTTDFPIDPLTTSGTALADILNRFCLAEDTQNSGTTAPPDTEAGMLWLDTSQPGDGVLKMRNQANNAWLTIANSGGPFLLADGTVTAPGLAWINEPGTGWYRRGQSLINFASGGVDVMGISTVSPTATGLGLSPRQAGESSIIVASMPPTSPDQVSLGIGSSASLGPYISSLSSGARVEPSIRYLAASHIFKSNTVGQATLVLEKAGGAYGNNLFGQTGDFPRWAVVLGDAAAETGGNAGSNFFIGAYADAGGPLGVPIAITRSNLAVSMAGSLFVGTGVTVNTGALRVTAGNGYIDAGHLESRDGVHFNGSNGVFGFTSQSFVPGQYQTLGIFNCASIGDTCFLQAIHQPGVDTRVRLSIGGTGNFYDFMNNCEANKTAGSINWVVTSDRALKEDVQAYTAGVDELIRLEPVSYLRKDVDPKMPPPKREIGLIAQDAQLPFPECVSEGDDGMLRLDAGPITWAMVNAIRELDARLVALETPAVPA